MIPTITSLLASSVTVLTAQHPAGDIFRITDAVSDSHVEYPYSGPVTDLPPQ